MSQYATSVAGTVTIATSFVTDSGTAVPAANILNVLATDVTTNNVNGIQTSSTGNNTLTISLTNRLQGTAQTIGAVTGDIITFGLGGATAVFRFEFLVAGEDAGTGDGVGYSVWGAARTDGATATIIQTPFVDADEDATLSAAEINLIASANNVILRFTGVAGQTIDLSGVGQYVVV